jgi:hypothetical protein
VKEVKAGSRRPSLVAPDESSRKWPSVKEGELRDGRRNCTEFIIGVLTI